MREGREQYRVTDMRMVLLISSALFLIAALGVSGCDNESAKFSSTNTPHTPNDESATDPSKNTTHTQTTDTTHAQNHEGWLFTRTARIMVTRSVIGMGKAYFKGTTELYNATLQTQLYQDEKPLDWWPANQDIKATGYVWEISVDLPEELPVESSYVLKIWDKDNPSLYGIYPIDLKGPPSVGW